MDESQDKNINPDLYALVLRKFTEGNLSLIAFPDDSIVNCIKHNEEIIDEFIKCPLCGSKVKNITDESKAYFEILMKAYYKLQKQKFVNQNVNNDKNYNPFLLCEKSVYKHIPDHLLLHNYYTNFFAEIRMLGCGSYGKVYLCRHQLDDIKLGEYAIKKIPVGESKEWLIKMIQEVKMREYLGHSNIVDYKHSWLELEKSDALNSIPLPWLFILMEYCDCGDLEEFIETKVKKKDTPLDDYEVWVIFLDIIHGLRHLHDRGIIHRDLKPSNIMLKSYTKTVNEDSKIIQVKALLADFGTANHMELLNAQNNQFEGTVEYMAPELLKTDSKGNYIPRRSYKNDMWSCGWLLYYLSYGDLPQTHDSQDPQIIRKNILTLAKKYAKNGIPIDEIPFSGIKTKIKRSVLIKKCIVALLHPIKERRPSCEDILSFSNPITRNKSLYLRKELHDKIKGIENAEKDEKFGCNSLLQLKDQKFEKKKKNNF